MGHRVLGDEGVEFGAADDVAEARVARVLGPRHLDGAAVGDDAQATHAMRVLEPVGEAHVVELRHRARGQTVTAGLFAGKAFALDEHHVEAMVRGPIRRGGTRGPAPDDEEVVAVG